MNDIYEQKAKKYKYKYLKLKKEYIGGVDDVTERYVCQYKQNFWIDALNYQIVLKKNNSNNIVRIKSSKKVYIYINSTQEIININDIQDRCKCFLFKLPGFSFKLSKYDNKGYDLEDNIGVNLDKINKMIFDSDKKIKIYNTYYNYTDYHNLYFIQKKNYFDTYEWTICNDKWQINILPNLLHYCTNNVNNNLFNYLHDNIKKKNFNFKFHYFKNNKIKYN